MQIIEVNLDDLLRSYPSIAAVRHFADLVQNHLQDAGMRLAKWKTNSRELAEHLIRRGVPEAALPEFRNSGKLLKVHGITWCPAENTFEFALEHVVALADLEKVRRVSQLVAPVYDSLGLLQLFLVRGKLLLREQWSTDLKWDQPHSEELTFRTRQWISEIPALAAIRMRRRLCKRDAPPTSRHLHLLGDSSPVAYVAVAYFQMFFADGSSETSIIMSKSRVAPRRPQSLPRLELMAAVLTTRLHNYIVGRLTVPIDRVTYYTDSMVTYFWIRSSSPGRFEPFVSNRIAEV